MKTSPPVTLDRMCLSTHFLENNPLFLYRCMFFQYDPLLYFYTIPSQGSGQERLGIYIKSVVAGGAADAVSILIIYQHLIQAVSFIYILSIAFISLTNIKQKFSNYFYRTAD